MPESLPSHLAQNMNVAAEPNARSRMRATWPVSTNDTSVAPLRHQHAERRDEHAHDTQHHEARQTRHALEQEGPCPRCRGCRCGARPCRRTGTAATSRWHGTATRNAAAQTASGVADARARPRSGRGSRWWSTRARAWRSLCEMAMNEHSGNVMPPTRTTMTDGTGHTSIDGRQLDEQEHARLDHGGRVEQRRGGRGRHHGAEQPRVERHLRGLGEARERQRARPAAPRAPGFWMPICRNSRNDSVPSWMALR